MERLTHIADFGMEDWEETLFLVPSDPAGAYNILDIARHQGEPEFNEILKNISLRLAAIEDILGDEYDLDRLRELKQADDEGRCGIPPVRMHQHIFRIFSGEIREETVCDAMWEPFTPRPRWKVWVMGSGFPYYWNDVFGKTVFLTRAEAEAALEGIKNG